MKEYDKLILASEMLVAADARLRSAMNDIDYISSILLSGAVIGIIQPLLKEQNGETSHQILARISKLIEPEGTSHEGLFRNVYNGLKHAGNNRRGIKASDDLLIAASFRDEAIYMIEEAKQDFQALKLPLIYNNALFSEAFLNVIQSLEPYA